MSLGDVTIVDSGMGNLASVMNMARKAGASVVLSSDPAVIRNAKRLILPGVGAFDHGVHQLKSSGLFDVLKERAAHGTPLLGLCLGMQLLARGSEEGSEEGLGLIDGVCKRFVFPPGSVLRIPHVGWNEPRVLRPNPLLLPDDPQPRFYFTHSYHLSCADEADIIAVADYGGDFPAAVGRGSVLGVQFHPEKSHRFGMQLLKRFAALPV